MLKLIKHQTDTPASKASWAKVTAASNKLQQAIKSWEVRKND